MRCYLCGAELGEDIVCPGCGIQIEVYKKILTISNHLYNEGLKLANIRDLCGAVEKLKLSLKYNKVNIPARNLLGLIYFELGDITSALGEWVISRNYMPEGNICNHYLELVQNDKNFINNVDKAVKKYNMAVRYCDQGDHDLAIIQLKKIATPDFNFVRGNALLGLLYLKKGDYRAAVGILRKALKVDTLNPMLKAYLAEAKAHIPQRSGVIKKSEDEYISYKSGNEMIITPRTTYKDTTPFANVINIVLGIAIGVLVTGFLIIPNVKQNAKSDAYTAVTEVNDELDSKEDTISSLNNKIDSLNGEIDDLESELSSNKKAISSYEQLIIAYQAFSEDKLTEAGNALSKVKQKYLSDDAQAIYDTINEDVQAIMLEELYENGVDSNSAGDYDEAISAFSEIIETEEEYEDGYALYYLAESYYNAGQYDEAQKYYERFIELYPGTQRADTAQSQIDAIENEEDED